MNLQYSIFTIKSQKVAGFTTALQSARLWLLGSPPDQIHGLGLHGTRPKNLLLTNSNWWF